MRDDLDVIVPVFDEEATVEELVRRLAAACPGARLIFVDNASTDRTAAILARLPEVTLVRHERNLGYGRSLATGLAAGKNERVVMIDGDLEYLPEDVPRLARALDSARAVYGSRFLARAGDASHGAAVWSLGNRLVTAAFNLSFGQRLTDLYTGIRGVRREALPPRPLTSSGFEFVLEFAAVLARAGIRIAEVPVGYTPRRAGHSKMRHAREAAKFAYHLVRLRLERTGVA
jgi:glycosyltransferase involved in cell wall biosynthesis